MTNSIRLKKIDCLCFIIKLLQEAHLLWALTGSMNHFLQGVKTLNPSDIDIITTEKAIYTIAEVLKSHIIVPLAFRETDTLRSFFAVFLIHSVRVEIMANIEDKVHEKWISSHHHWEDNIVHIEINKCEIPCLSLEFEFHIYQKLNQPNRCIAIKKVLTIGNSLL